MATGATGATATATGSAASSGGGTPHEDECHKYFIRRQWAAGYDHHEPEDWLRLFETRAQAEEWAEKAANRWQAHRFGENARHSFPVSARGGPIKAVVVLLRALQKAGRAQLAELVDGATEPPWGGRYSSEEAESSIRGMSLMCDLPDELFIRTMGYVGHRPRSFFAPGETNHDSFVIKATKRLDDGRWATWAVVTDGKICGGELYGTSEQASFAAVEWASAAVDFDGLADDVGVNVVASFNDREYYVLLNPFTEERLEEHGMDEQPDGVEDPFATFEVVPMDEGPPPSGGALSLSSESAIFDFDGSWS